MATLLFENTDFLVVDKPAGLLSIPGRDLNESSLYQELKKKYPKLLVVHRLDRETSGCLLFAKNPEFHRLANAWFEKHEVRKIYQALVYGELKRPALKINFEINSQKALSQVLLKKYYPREKVSWVQVQILTGRRHQIRIHLSQSGHPLLGDHTYPGSGVPSLSFPVDRVALHAEKLELPNGMYFSAPFPKDFSFWLKKLEEEA